MIIKYSDYINTKKNNGIICTSILSANFANLEKDIQLIEEQTDWLHFDVMDGIFVPNISFGIPVMKSIKKITNLPFDVHLMIVDPMRYIDDFADAGADLIVIHAEACTHLNKVVNLIKARGVSAGIAINPATPISVLEEILPQADLILLMTVNPGFGGQSYIETMTDKIIRLKGIINANGYDTHIQVDGGIGISNIRAVFKAGANVMVVGNSVFSKEDPNIALEELRKCLE